MKKILAITILALFGIATISICLGVPLWCLHDCVRRGICQESDAWKLLGFLTLVLFILLAVGWASRLN